MSSFVAAGKCELSSYRARQRADRGYRNNREKGTDCNWISQRIDELGETKGLAHATRRDIEI